MENSMTRTLRIALTGTLCLVFGACAGRTLVSVPVAAAPEVPPIELATLPVGSYTLDELLAPMAPPESQPVTPGCIPFDRIADAKKMLESMATSMGTKEYRYTEVRGSAIRFKDVEKKFPVTLLNTDTCELSTTVFIKRGADLITEDGIVAEPTTRANGIRWNNWATEYTVDAPERTVVLAVKFPYRRQVTERVTVRTANGGSKVVRRTRDTVAEVIHSPFDGVLRTDTTVAAGIEYLASVVQEARTQLRAAGVQSRAFPGRLVTDVSQLTPEFTVRRAPNEHMDPTEFLLDPDWTTDRMLVIIAANTASTSAYTCSSAAACGLWQFTSGTYSDMRRLYPGAGLLSDFTSGWRDHVNIAKAAVLLDDSNLAALIEEFGSDIADDPRLEEYLTAAYNTGVGRVKTVVKIAEQKNVSEWTDARGSLCSKRNRYAQCLLTETKGYIAKLRFLQEVWPARTVARTPDR
jgi:hypothetical protein